MAQVKTAALIRWLAEQDDTTLEEVLGYYAMRMRQAANDARRDKVELTDTDRLVVFTKALAEARLIEVDRLSTRRHDLTRIARMRYERDARRHNEKSHPCDGRKFIEKNWQILVCLRDNGLTFEKIRDYIKDVHNVEVSVGLVHTVYQEIRGKK